jgi:hypothetical protein
MPRTGHRTSPFSDRFKKTFNCGKDVGEFCPLKYNFRNYFSNALGNKCIKASPSFKKFMGKVFFSLGF